MFCRIRPAIAEDGISPYEAVLQHEYDSDVVVVENKKGRSQQFEMDRLFSPESSQTQVGLIKTELFVCHKVAGIVTLPLIAGLPSRVPR